MTNDICISVSHLPLGRWKFGPFGGTRFLLFWCHQSEMAVSLQHEQLVIVVGILCNVVPSSCILYNAPKGFPTLVQRSAQRFSKSMNVLLDSRVLKISTRLDKSRASVTIGK